MKKLSSKVYIILLLLMLLLWLTFFLYFLFYLKLKWNEIGDSLNTFTSLIASFSFVFLFMQVIEQQAQINEVREKETKKEKISRYLELLKEIQYFIEGMPISNKEQYGRS